MISVKTLFAWNLIAGVILGLAVLVLDGCASGGKLAPPTTQQKAVVAADVHQAIALGVQATAVACAQAKLLPAGTDKDKAMTVCQYADLAAPLAAGLVQVTAPLPLVTTPGSPSPATVTPASP